MTAHTHTWQAHTYTHGGGDREAEPLRRLTHTKRQRERERLQGPGSEQIPNVKCRALNCRSNSGEWDAAAALPCPALRCQLPRTDLTGLAFGITLKTVSKHK